MDGRPRAEFAAAHLPGSLNIELNDSFASYVGWFVPFGAPIALVLPEPLGEALEEAAVMLFRIGYDRVVGGLAGGVAAWEGSGGAIEAYPDHDHRGPPRAGPRAAGTAMRSTCATRRSGATTASCPARCAIPLGDLPAQLATMPRDGPVTVMCKSGARASIAASLLDAAGVDVRLIARGGAPDWPSGTMPDGPGDSGIPTPAGKGAPSR